MVESDVYHGFYIVFKNGGPPILNIQRAVAESTNHNLIVIRSNAWNMDDSANLMGSKNRKKIISCTDEEQYGIHLGST